MATKALSLWNPWAVLVARGYKCFETRSWQTPYRGELVIHAAKRPLTANEHMMITLWVEAEYLDDGYGSIIHEMYHSPLLWGAAIGVVTLEDCIKTEKMRDLLPPRELAFGNYSAARHAWKFSNPRMFVDPVPYRGQQALFMFEQALPAFREFAKTVLPGD